MTRVRLRWHREDRTFETIEPDVALVAQHASQLCAWYNARENASMMDGSGTMSREDVLDFWLKLRAGNARGFLSFVDGQLVGDADIRSIVESSEGAVAEFAVMIGAAAHKGRGYGRTLSTMVHVFAFRELGLERIYVPPRRDNAPVHALNAFLGYERDDSLTARSFADGPDSDTYSISSARFRERHPDAWRDVIATTVPLTASPSNGSSESSSE